MSGYSVGDFVEVALEGKRYSVRIVGPVEAEPNDVAFLTNTVGNTTDMARTCVLCGKPHIRTVPLEQP